MGPDAGKRIYDWSIRKSYFDSIATGLKYATESDVPPSSLATAPSSAGLQNRFVKVERPEKSYEFVSVRSSSGGQWRLDASTFLNRYMRLLSTASSDVSQKAGKEFFKSADEVTDAVTAQVFLNGVPGDYRVEYLRDGSWYVSQYRVRISHQGDAWQAMLKNVNLQEAQWRQVNLGMENNEIVIQDLWEGNVFDVAIGTYDYMTGSSIGSFGAANSIRFVCGK